MSDPRDRCQTCGDVLGAKNSYRGGGFLRAVNCIPCSTEKRAATLQRRMEARRDEKMRRRIKKRIRTNLDYNLKLSRERRARQAQG